MGRFADKQRACFVAHNGAARQPYTRHNRARTGSHVLIAQLKRRLPPRSVR